MARRSLPETQSIMPTAARISRMMKATWSKSEVRICSDSCSPSPPAPETMPMIVAVRS
jgi:hypothetical protein